MSLDPGADPFKPPSISTLVCCLHCGREYDSYLIEWRVKTSRDGLVQGFWCCPTPDCGGLGFGCDILPVDPEYQDENGERMWIDDEEEAAGGVDESYPEAEGPGNDSGAEGNEDLPW